MAINLADYEIEAAFDGDSAAEAQLLRARLSQLQNLHIAHRCRTLIVLEGWDGSGKAAILQTLAGIWDPRFVRICHFGAPDSVESERHFLWRFWQKMPRAGNITLFERSHYRRVLDDRVNGSVSEGEWRRGYDEINEFEAQQKDGGTKIIKLFLHMTEERQRAVLTMRLHAPESRWTVTAEQLHRLSQRGAWEDAINAMFAATDMRWAPWKLIDAQDPATAELAVLQYLAKELAAHVPADFPEMDGEAAALADLILTGTG
jgi:AMP-polyphosphate phosphotransferase